jgi:hypothetical protein
MPPVANSATTTEIPKKTEMMEQILKLLQLLNANNTQITTHLNPQQQQKFIQDHRNNKQESITAGHMAQAIMQEKTAKNYQQSQA